MCMGVDFDGVICNVSIRSKTACGVDGVDDQVKQLLWSGVCQVDVVKNMVTNIPEWKRLDDTYCKDGIVQWSCV